MTVYEFPLAWRWTDKRYTLFPKNVLEQLSPFPPDKALQLYNRAKILSHTDDSRALRITTGHSDKQVQIWLRAQQPILSEEINICWSKDLALQTSWGIFCEFWDDFCYPSSDDIIVIPFDESWMLMYHHWEEFEFHQR